MERKIRLSVKTKTLLAFAVLLLFTAFSATRSDLFGIGRNIEILSAVYRQVTLNYVEKVDNERLMRAGINAMLDELDPYTEYVPESDIENFNLKYVHTQYGGLGAKIFMHQGKAFLEEVYEGYPAHRFGLEAGDELVAINEQPLAGKTSNEISQLLKGPKGTLVILQVMKARKQKSETLRITRERITQPNVSYFERSPQDIGYIKLDKFLENATDEVINAIRTMQNNDESNLKGLVLDLRDNSGGILQESVKIVNLFVNKGFPVVTQRGNENRREYTYRTSNNPYAPHLPLAILINGKSASAAEIVAGALQDMDRAIVLGTRSFGKGLVQQTFRLPYSSMVKVTVAKYYTPSGRCIQALDYSHHDTISPSSQIISTSFNEFKTLGGRLVYDGSGIYPDILIEKEPLSKISLTLLRKSFIFNYATLFKERHKIIDDPLLFTITDQEYDRFIHYLSDKDYNYQTRSEKLIQALITDAALEKRPPEILNKLNELGDQIVNSKESDLIIHKNEIKKLLESEIISRYYFQHGRLSYNNRYDKVFDRAVTILATDDPIYAEILEGNGAYKQIGKLTQDLASSNEDERETEEVFSY